MSADPEKTAKDAFLHPSSLASKRLGTHVSPRGTSTTISEAESVRSARSRRTPSLIKSDEDAEVFDQMTAATGVIVPSPKNRNMVQSVSVDPQKTAKDAFSNPSSLAAKRLGTRVSPRGTSSSMSEAESVRSTRSRRAPSLITSIEDAEVFDQMTAATGVIIPSPKTENEVQTVDPETTAKNAFSNPSSYASKRLGTRVSPRGTSSSISDAESVRSTRSRRAPSLITSVEEAEIFDEMTASTGVVIPSPKSRNEAQPISPVEGILKHAEELVRTLSPTAQPFPDDEVKEDSAFSFDQTEGKKKRLDFIYNDNAFHVLAEVLVDFFEARIDDDGLIVLRPEDGEKVDRIVPESARLKFIEAVRYRLQRTPKEALTPVQQKTLQCQRLGLDKFGCENPIVAALSESTEPVLLPVVEDRDDDESFASNKSSSEKSESSNAGSTSEKASDSSPFSAAVADDGSEVESTSNACQKIDARHSVSFADQNEDSDSPASRELENNSGINEEEEEKEESPEMKEVDVRIPLSPVIEPQRDEHNFHHRGDQVTNVSNRSESQTPPAEESISNRLAIKTPPAEESIINRLTINVCQVDHSVENEPRNDELQSPISREEGGELKTSSEDLVEGEGDSATRQQLFAELREAKQFLADSVSDETKQFWGKTVEDLKQRIKSHDHALAGISPRSPPAEVLPQQTSMPEEPTREATVDKQPQPQPPPLAQPSPQVRTSPVDIVENNRRLLSEFQHRDFYGAPALSGSKSTTSSHPISEPDYEAPMVDVVAPADLPGGYHFEAEIEGQRFLATVPPGGVQQGETFTCYMRELDSVAIDIPVGYWKDEPQDVFKYGCCHPVIWNSIFCPLIPLSQIQTRVHLDFLGRPKTTETDLSNRAMMLIVMAFWLIINLGLFLGYHIKWSRGVALSIADYAAVALINAVFVGFIVFVTQSTRSSIREKFLIREERCYDLEDLSCSALCLPCTVAQMSRHTANYDDYEAVCCSKSGLPDGVRVNQAPVKSSGSYVV